jgi:P27 family predicted phage terminase small subunit
MARRGRKPLPNHIKILRGMPEARINRAEPVPPPGRPEIPDHLDSLARGEWERIVTILDHMGLCSKAEAPVLSLYCEVYSKWLRARGEIVKRGMVIERDIINSKGVKSGSRLFGNPAVGVELACIKLMKDLLAEMGLTPSARSRLRCDKNEAADPFEDFLKMHQPG